MKEIIFRDYHQFLSEPGPEYSVRVLPGRAVIGRPYAIVLPYPTIGDIVCEMLSDDEKGVEPLIIAIAEPFRKALLEAAFPSIAVIDRSGELSSALSSHKERKEIRFTESEKRMLRELPFGPCSKELSLRLGISERSVRRAKERLMRKTGLLSSGQLMIYALLSLDISIRSS